MGAKTSAAWKEGTRRACQCSCRPAGRVSMEDAEIQPEDDCVGDEPIVLAERREGDLRIEKQSSGRSSSSAEGPVIPAADAERGPEPSAGTGDNAADVGDGPERSIPLGDGPSSEASSPLRGDNGAVHSSGENAPKAEMGEQGPATAPKDSKSKPPKEKKARSSVKRQKSRKSELSDRIDAKECSTTTSASTADTLPNANLPKESAASALPPQTEPPVGLEGSALQRYYGAQSKRGKAQQFQLAVLDRQPHCKACFEEFHKNEEELCGEYTVFYHSYTDGAVLYELHAAVAAVLYGYDSKQAPLPRLKTHKFVDIPDATTLKHKYETEYVHDKKDHHDDYRDVAFSAMCSLVSKGPEVSIPVVFVHGYNHKDDRVDFPGYLERFFLGMLPAKGRAEQQEVKAFIENLLKHCKDYCLDTRNFFRSPVRSPAMIRGGHMLQMFIRRDLVDHLAYAAAPFGDVDQEREPLSTWMDGDTDVSWGQARILCHPEYCMDSSSVRMFVASCDEFFHDNRGAFQTDLVAMIERFLSAPGRRESALRYFAHGPVEIPKRKISWSPSFKLKF